MRDLLLIEGLARRDKIVFDYIFNLYYSSLCAFSMQYLNFRNSGEDLVMVTQFSPSDGTKVWLNSGSELRFPNSFVVDIKEVKLNGEAFFEVTKDEKKPFKVNAKYCS